MPRVTIYAATPGMREALETVVRMDDDLELRDGGDRAPRSLDDPREGDVLLMTGDLPPAERLQILGLVWRSNHPPGTLFVDGDRDERRSGSWVVEPADRERCLASIRALAGGESLTRRLTVSFRAGPAGDAAAGRAAANDEIDAGTSLPAAV